MDYHLLLNYFLYQNICVKYLWCYLYIQFH